MNRPYSLLPRNLWTWGEGRHAKQVRRDDAHVDNLLWVEKGIAEVGGGNWFHQKPKQASWRKWYFSRIQDKGGWICMIPWSKHHYPIWYTKRMGLESLSRTWVNKWWRKELNLDLWLWHRCTPKDTTLFKKSQSLHWDQSPVDVDCISSEKGRKHDSHKMTHPDTPSLTYAAFEFSLGSSPSAINFLLPISRILCDRYREGLLCQWESATIPLSELSLMARGPWGSNFSNPFLGHVVKDTVDHWENLGLLLWVTVKDFNREVPWSALVLSGSPAVGWE